MFMNTPTLMTDARSYTLVAHRGTHDPAEYVVVVVDDDDQAVMKFYGASDELHGLFLGLHNVLVDAGRDEGQSELVIPARTDEGDDRGGSAGE